MKISLNWVFDHIKGDLSHVDIPQFIESFIKTTAEIEGWKKVDFSGDNLTLGKVIAIEDENIEVYSQELNKNYTLPVRADLAIGSFCLITDIQGQGKWATSTVFGGTKEMLLPSVHVTEKMLLGEWKAALEKQDYIIEVDNKSINSRPDLWSHRGLAREIAAILNLSLRPIEEFIIEKDTVVQQFSSPSSIDNPFSLIIQDSTLCTRFAGLYLSSIVSQASSLSMVVRLSRIDSRAIDYIVDTTNYVMFDLGQPMHAFDADALRVKEITIGKALPKEKLALLDGETIELTTDDIVVADGNKAVSLAGVMGGALTSINRHTKSVFLESAHFDPVIIRRTSARHKKRTESSIRFEKSLDPYQNVDAIKRCMFLMDAAGVQYHASDTIISLGGETKPKVITLLHAFIESRLGVIIKPERIIEILVKIAFQVVQSLENNEVVYTVTVPSFRATKDIKIPEDIVEEVGRYIGYDTIPRVMPALQLQPSDLNKTYITRAIKSFLSYGLMMHELYGYSFFDESVLKELQWQPTDFVAIQNPISENYTRLVTSLQPHLLKAIGENSIHYSQLRFYEWGRVWRMHADEVVEQKSLSGIFFERGEVESGQIIDFYSGKGFLTRMFEKLHMDIVWQPYQGINFSWSSLYQTAQLMHQDKCIGIAGMVQESVLQSFSCAGGSAFIFEIDADYLLEYKKPSIRFESLSKYPSVQRDISMLLPLNITTDMLIHLIKAIDNRIQAVTLIDFFSKPEWKDQKAMTFNVEIGDKEKTLVTEQVEEIYNRIVVELQQQGAVIR